MQVIRANYGLRSLEQAPLLQQRIRSEERRGDFAAAWELEQDLLTLARRQRDDLAAAPILHEIGDKRMDLLKRLSRRRDSAADRPRLLLPGAAGAVELGGAGRFRQLHFGAKGHRGGNDPHRRRNCSTRRRSECSCGRGLFQRRASRARDQVDPQQLRLRRLVPGRPTKPVAARFVWRRQRGAAVATNRLGHPGRRLGPAVRSTAAGDRALRGNLRVPRATRRGSCSDRRVVLARDAAHAAHVRGKPAAAARAQTATGYVDIAFEITYFGTARHVDVVSSSQRVEGRAQRPRSPRLARPFPTDRDGRRVRALDPGRRALLRRGVARRRQSTTRMPRGPCRPRSFRNPLRRHGAARHGRDEPAARDRDRRRDAAPRRQRRRRRDRRERSARAHGADELRHRRRPVRDRLGRGRASACTA